MFEALRRKRDRAVQRFLDAGLEGRLHVPISADDLLDADLYWESSPLAFVAKQTVLVFDDSVSTIDGGVLIVCLRELKSLGFSFAVADELFMYTGASTSEARVGTPPRSSLSPRA